MSFIGPAVNAANQVRILLDELTRQPSINDRILEQAAIVCVDALEEILSSKELYRSASEIKKNYRIHKEWTKESLDDLRKLRDLLKSEKELMRRAGLSPQIIKKYFPSEEYLSSNFSKELIEPDNVVEYVEKLRDTMRGVRDDISRYREKKKIVGMLKGAIAGTAGIATLGLNGILSMGNPTFAPMSTISGGIGGLMLREGWTLVNKNQEKPTPPVIKL
ncbi:hypothetical protein ACJ41P_06425 [Azospirillum argentinense]|uniref:Uncharacterized protein n=1 Tax=Azospirillum argentinense TaxID=2970906 RepID=A0ABW8V381_9PROT